MSVVYFMQSVEGGPIKIGVTGNLTARHKALEQYYGCELAILATLAGERDKEREIHKRFSHLRFGKTEQFKPAKELLEFIGRPLLVSANPDAVELMAILDHVQPNAITIRGSAKWKEWLEGFAKHLRSKPTQVIDRSLAKLAEIEKYKEPPDRMES